MTMVSPSLAHALDSSDARRKKRSLSLRQRKEIQEVLRRGGADHSGLHGAGSAAVRHLHRLLRRLGQGHDLRPRDEAGPAVPLPRRRLLQHLRAPPGLLRALGRALRLRAEGIPDRDARQARARRAPVVEVIRLLKNASEGSVFLQPLNWGITRGRSPLPMIWYCLTNSGALS